MKSSPLKGMRDILPREQRVRDYVQGEILKTYRAAGFERISTPILEDMENLDKSDGGDNLNLIFKVLKRGEKLEKALAAGDEAERAAYLSRANCGRYYEKFACMAGMLYLAGQWRQGGTAALAEQFRAGYHGFAERCAG